MTDGPFRTPPEVLLLNEQLADKTRECEDLRAEISSLKEKLSKAKLRDPEELRDAREWWTWRLFIVFGIGFLAWVVFVLKDCEAPDSRCRDAMVNGSERTVCPYGGQLMTPTSDPKIFKCTCPTAAPAGSKP